MASALAWRRWARMKGNVSTRLRLASGLVLMAFATTHLANHTLALVSVAAVEAGRRIFIAFWGFPPVQWALIVAAAVHVLVALGKLVARRSWRMPAWQWLQIAAGCTVPFFLTMHVLGTEVLARCCGLHDSYVWVYASTWPDFAWQQTVLVLVVWLHGCLGIHYWLRLKPGYRRLAPLLLVAAVLLPTLALLGYAGGAREVMREAAEAPAWLANLAQQQHWPTPEIQAWTFALNRQILLGLVVLVALVVLLDLVRTMAIHRRARVRITYDGGRTITVPKGLSVLEASRMNGIAHAAICGGRGRCSTCRIRVQDGGTQPPPSPEEERVLERIGAGPGVRLACQLRPTSSLTITRLMPATTQAQATLSRMDPNAGREREIVVLFADLRDFTRMAETRLPYDVVFLLNRYFAAMGAVIEGQGGRVDKFIGDGIMALFGVEDGVRQGARQALQAVGGMARALDELNHELAVELREPLRMGIGLHAGPTIVGEMGYGDTTSLTAVGDVVNTASRLEALTKELAVQLVVSADLVDLAGMPLHGARPLEADLRGRRGQLRILTLESAAELGVEDPGPASGMQPGWTGLLARLWS